MSPRRRRRLLLVLLLLLLLLLFLFGISDVRVYTVYTGVR